MALRSTVRTLPDSLAALNELALDLRWVGSQTASRVWGRLDPEQWERTRNPLLVLLNADRERLEEAARDEAFLEELATWLERRDAYFRDPGWFARRAESGRLGGVAYLSMEFGLGEGLPIYSGGLGILAGDHLKSASDLGVPVVGVGLLYQQGYFRQVLDAEGRQLEAYPFNDPTALPVAPATDADGRWVRVSIPLPGRRLRLRAWEARVGKVPLYLLDSNDPMNNPWDRAVTGALYDAGAERRLLQEIALGAGGWMLLRRLGVGVDVCHLNEGHAAFAVLARAGMFMRDHGVSLATALATTRAGNVFTTHTPVDAAFDRFDPALLRHVGAPLAERVGLRVDELLGLGRERPEDESEPFNMAFLAVRGCGRVNGVSRLHGRNSRAMFARLFPRTPLAEVPIGSITNGVHVPTWDSPAANGLWRRAMGGRRWLESLEEACRAIEGAPDAEVWTMRSRSRAELVSYVRRRYERQVRHRGAADAVAARAGRVLDPEALTLGFARRFTAYKRPNLLLRHAERLAALLRDADRPVQLVVAGKAHPRDERGKEMVRVMASWCAREDLFDRAVFLQDYDMSLAEQLVWGVDVWINTPHRDAEASGTSGMKTIANGGLNLSALDGWWDEAYEPGLGWAIGGPDGSAARDELEAGQLIDLIEREVVPCFYDRDERGIPRAWIERVRRSMAALTCRFSSNRMVAQYVTEVYLPAAEAGARRSADSGRLGREIAGFRARVDEAWPRIGFVGVRTERDGDRWRFDAEVDTGGLEPGEIRVELFADGACGPIVEPMASVDGRVWTGRVAADRPAGEYTPRIRPWHAEALVPIEAPQVRWWR